MLVTINIDRNSLPPHTDEEFEEWVKFEIGEIGGMNADNPLQQDLEACIETI